ncbi:MAG TPA: NADH-quinone oxidoreductase subunit A [Bryobacteraceae bacterium]|jgi:NADH-quinone oxidoreductase subunit A|nr:NADH-quinone oxidoreductase subunit A [Bryobacteraceae bacterium]HXR74675.1 NADH-quinone oxidoreductase subunit A [Bryobacteraceae bacterium]
MWPLVLYFVLVLLLVTGMLLVSYVLGQRHTSPATGSPYEAGIVSEGSARLRLSAQFYLIAMFFVIFDVEAVILFSWAVAARESGWAGFWEAVIFAGILMATLLYLARVGALNWSTPKSTQAAKVRR